MQEQIEKLTSAAHELFEGGYSKTSIYQLIRDALPETSNLLEQLKRDRMDIELLEQAIRGRSASYIKERFDVPPSFSTKSGCFTAAKKIKKALGITNQDVKYPIHESYKSEDLDRYNYWIRLSKEAISEIDSRIEEEQ